MTKQFTRDFSNYSETKFQRELFEIDFVGTIVIGKSFSTFQNKLNKFLI